MKCPECEKEGLKSCVYPGSIRATCLYYPPGFYNQEGKWIDNPDRNVITAEYTCSNGHCWSEKQ